MAVIQERAPLLAVIDTLVRWKFLETHRLDALSSKDKESLKHIEQEIQILRNNAMTQLGIRDLQALWQDCIEALVKESKTISKNTRDEHASNQSSQSKTFKSYRVANFVSKHAMEADIKATYALGMLSENLDILKEELMKQLGHTVTASDVDVAEQGFALTSWNLLALSLYIALPLLGMWSVLK